MESIDSYLNFIILKTLGNISKDTREILNKYINYRINLGEHVLFKESGNSFVIYNTSVDGENLFILEVVLCNGNKEYIKVRYVDIDKKETIDKFEIYHDGIVGYLGNCNEKYQSNTVFRGDVVIPNSSDKTNLVWLEGSTNKEIFDLGLRSYNALVNDNKMGKR